MVPFTCFRAAHVTAPLTRFVAPQGAPRKAPVAPFACVRAADFSTPLSRLVDPQGAHVQPQ
eukprot:6858342-Pyramimonas_sp.AAC.1